LDDIAKTYAAPAATVWFKVTNNSKPTKEEYNQKIVAGSITLVFSLLQNCQI
jgi:hypothetical protein